MGWLTGGWVACCTASLVTGSDGMLSDPQIDARTSNSRSASKFPSPYWLSDALLEPSSNVPPTSSALYSSGVVSHSTTRVLIRLPIISAATTALIHEWESEQVHPELSKIASSIKQSRTASSLAVTPEPRLSLSDSLVSTLLQDVVSSQTLGTQLPIFTSALVHSLPDSLSTSLLSTTYPEAQPRGNETTISNGISSLTTTQHADLLELELVFAPFSILVVPSQEGHHVDVPTKTSSAFSNSVSSLADRSWVTLSAAGASRSSGTEVATVAANTLTTTVPRQTASTPKVVENFSLSTSLAQNNTWTVSVLSTVRSERTVTSAPWLSLVFTWANSQTTILSAPILSAESVIPTTSSLYTASNFSGFISSTIQTPLPQPATPSTSSPHTQRLQGDSSFSFSGLYPSPAPGNDVLSGGASNYSLLQMTPTRLQLTSLSTLFSQPSLMLTPIQTAVSTPTVWFADAQNVPSGPISSESSPPCSKISTSYIGWTNTSAYRPTGESATFSQPAISTSLGANSTRNPLLFWYMSRTSSHHLYSTNTPPSVPKYMEISSFITRVKSSAEPPSQATLVASDIDTATTRSPMTTPFPVYSSTETVATASSPPLTSSETAGVAIGSTAGLVLAIIAAVFVVRRYHASRSAKHGSDGSSGAYPQLAYLYDPSLGGAESDNGGDDETSTFMSGGAMSRLVASMRNRTPPPPPHNSIDFGYRQLYSPDTHYSDPGNSFTDIEDPFLEWRSSGTISTPNGTRFALAAAVARYSNGPQKPLPSPPDSVSTQAFRDHIIPSPTPSPIANGYGLRHGHVRSSSRSSVQSQRSLKKFYCSSSSSSGSRDYGRGRGESLTSIHETDSHQLDLMEHDLLLPVDTRSETSDSVVVYASTLTSKSLTQYSIPTNNPASVSTSKHPETKSPTSPSFHYKHSWPLSRREDPSAANVTPLSPPFSGPSPIHPITTDISYADFPSPPSSTCTPTHKGCDEMKRISTDYIILMSPPAPLSPSSSSPPLPSPPPPLKKRSLVSLPQKMRLSDMVDTTRPRTSSLDHQSVPAPLRIKTRFPEREDRGSEVQRRSWLDRV